MKWEAKVLEERSKVRGINLRGLGGGALLEPRSKGDLGGEGQRNQQKREKNAYTQVMLANWEILREKGLGKV